jgi:malonyl-CoA/methylmalonyl-CoA synthetase
MDDARASGSVINGEAVVAVIATGSTKPVDEPAILEELAGKLAKFKHPKRFVTTRELPRNVMGKVQKAELRRHFAELFQ